MRLTISKDSEPIQIDIEGQQASSCTEIQPGIRVHMDNSGSVVGVDIVPEELTRSPDKQREPLHPEKEAANGTTRSPLGQELMRLRESMWAAGLGPTTEEEFDRVLAEYRGYSD